MITYPQPHHSSQTVEATIKKYNASVAGLEQSATEFKNLTSNTSAADIDVWSKLDAKAQKARRAIDSAPAKHKEGLLKQMEIFDFKPNEGTSPRNK